MGDKVPVLLKERVEAFFDDKPRYVEAARSQGINAHLFQNWNRVAEIIGPADYGQEIGFIHRLIFSSAVGRLVKKWLKAGLRALAGRSEKLRVLRAEFALLPTCATGTVGVGKEEVVFKKLMRPLTAYHATSAEGERVIAKEGLMPKAILGQETKQTSVVFFYLDWGVAYAFSFFGQWPFRFLFNFRMEPKKQILEVIVPVGARVGITSWHEVVSLDVIPPVKSRAAERECSLVNGRRDAATPP